MQIKSKEWRILAVASIIGMGLLAQAAHAALSADVLQPLSSDGSNALLQIQRTVWPAVREGNPIAIAIARQTMLALGQDMALKRTPFSLRRPIARDVQQAWVKTVRAKADKGDLFFVMALSILYQEGLGLDKDAGKAVELWQQAAKRSYGPAQYAMACAYAQGIGVAQDFSRAAQYYRAAGELGHATALFSLGSYYQDGKGVPQDAAQARRCWEKAAAMGHVGAQYGVGRYLEEGRGGDRNVELGHSLILQTARQGYKKARNYLAYYAKNFSSPLHDAVKRDDETQVEQLTTNKAAINKEDTHGRTPLHLAVSLRLKLMADMLLAKGADIHLPDIMGQTPLHTALRLEPYPAKEHLVALLIKKGATVDVFAAVLMDDLACLKQQIEAKPDSVNAVNANGDTPLHWAAFEGRSNAVAVLCARGAWLDAVNANGFTPLHAALMGRDLRSAWQINESHGPETKKDPVGAAPVIQIIETLIAHGALMDITCDSIEWYSKRIPLGAPLHIALKMDFQEAALVFITNGASMTTTNTFGDTPLNVCHSAAMAQALLKQGADVNAKDSAGSTPLHTAAAERNKDLTQFLLEKGAMVNAQDAKGWIPLHYLMAKDALTYDGSRASVVANLSDVFDLLLAHGADPKLVNQKGQTPLDLAAAHGPHSVMLRLYKQHGIAVPEGITPSACELITIINGNWSLEKIEELVAEDPEIVHGVNASGDTPMHAVARCRREAIGEYLLSKGANINAANHKGETPLHEAERRGTTNMIEWLVQHGADLKARDKQGRSVLQIAIEENRTNVAAFIQQLMK